MESAKDRKVTITEKLIPSEKSSNAVMRGSRCGLYVCPPFTVHLFTVHLFTVHLSPIPLVCVCVVLCIRCLHVVFKWARKKYVEVVPCYEADMLQVSCTRHHLVLNKLALQLYLVNQLTTTWRANSKSSKRSRPSAQRSRNGNPQSLLSSKWNS